MPKVVRYHRQHQYSVIKHTVLTIPGLASTAWWLGPKEKQDVMLVALPTGNPYRENLFTVLGRLERGELIVHSPTPYACWQDAALALYGRLAVPYIQPSVQHPLYPGVWQLLTEETVADSLVARIERAAGV